MIHVFSDSFATATKWGFVMNIWILITCSVFGLSVVKAQDLKRLQTPLLEEFHNAMNPGIPQGALGDTTNNYKLPNLPTISKSPKRLPSRRLSAISDAMPSPFKSSKRTLNTSRVMQPETEPTQVNESTKKAVTNSRWWVSSRWSNKTLKFCFFFDVDVSFFESACSFSEIRREWEEELYEELERHRGKCFLFDSINIFSNGFEF